VKKAYRNLALTHHPDRVSHLGEEYRKIAEEKFKEISEAYEVIVKELAVTR
jgi:DnaJ like chaperone protein